VSLCCCKKFFRNVSTNKFSKAFDVLPVFQLMCGRYVYDTQILGICCPSESEALQNRVFDCLDAVRLWMAANCPAVVRINTTVLLSCHYKTEALWCLSLRRQHQIPTRPVRVGSASVQPVATVRNLGVYLQWHRLHGAWGARPPSLIQMAGYGGHRE